MRLCQAQRASSASVSNVLWASLVSMFSLAAYWRHRELQPKPKIASTAEPGNTEGVRHCPHRGKTVTKPLVLSLLELPLSEKQIPQVIEKYESG
jgi:hypothetical protein